VSVLETSMTAIPLTFSVEHVDVHENAELALSAYVREMSPSLAQLNESQSEVHTGLLHLHSQAKILLFRPFASSE
jgi:hypothetical protein